MFQKGTKLHESTSSSGLKDDGAQVVRKRVVCSRSFDHPPTSGTGRGSVWEAQPESQEKIQDPGSRSPWRDGQSCFPSPGDVMRLVCRQIAWEGVSGLSTVPQLQHSALSAAPNTGQVFQAREECKGPDKGGGGSLHPADAKPTHQRQHGRLRGASPELCTLEHSLLGFAR